MVKVLFLCHGNICRSPMAEFIMKDKLRKLNKEKDFEVNSKALTSEEIGNDTYYLAKDCLDRHHIPYTYRKASKFTKADYDYYDEIYIMDENNKRQISYVVDDKLNKISMLNGSIEDPWYTDNFDKVYSEIEEGVDNILKRHEEVL